VQACPLRKGLCATLLLPITFCICFITVLQTVWRDAIRGG
jgi:hypothetical protein